MSDIRNDKLAERVRKRRLAEGIAPVTTEAPAAKQDTIHAVETLDSAADLALKKELNGAEKDNAFISAERIAKASAHGASNIAIAAALGMSKAWVSKRLALLDATPEMAEKLRSGAISATDFYTRSRASKNTGHRCYVRQPSVTIHAAAAQALVEILAILATSKGVAGIRLDTTLNKRELAAALNLRAAEIRGLL